MFLVEYESVADFPVPQMIYEWTKPGDETYIPNHGTHMERESSTWLLKEGKTNEPQ